MAVPGLIYRSGGREIIPGFMFAANKLERPKINRLFFPIKAVYFFFLAGSATILPFMPVYMQYIGLSAVQIGLVRGLEPFVGSVGAPFLGSLADKYSKHRLIMVSGMIGSTAIFATVTFMPLLNHGGTMDWFNITNSEDPALETWKESLLRAKDAGLNSHHKDRGDKYWMLLKDSFPANCVCNEQKWREGEAVVLKNSLHGANTTVAGDRFFQNYCSGCELCAKLETGLWTNWDFCQSPNCTQSLQEYMQRCASDYCTASKCMGTNTGTSLDTPNKESHVNLDKQQPFSKNSTVLFATMLVVIFSYRFIKSPVLPILDATTMLLVKELNKIGVEADYGRQRLWGAVSWGTIAPLTGFLIDLYSTHVVSFNNYLPAFCIYITLLIVCSICASFISIPKHNPPAETVSRNLSVMLRKANVLVFLLVLGITGFSVSIMSTYLFLFLQELGGTHTLMGLTLTLTCVSEVPFMFFATKLIDRLGHQGVISLALFCYAVRFCGYSLLWNPWLVLPIELLHGITYGALWPTCTSYCNLIAPEGMATSMQSVAAAVKVGLGLGTGAIVGGVIYHSFGPRNLFRGSAVLCLVALLFYWPISTYLERRDARRNLQAQYEEI